MWNSYIFSVSVNIGKENFGEWLTIHQICQFFPAKIFSVVSVLKQTDAYLLLNYVLTYIHWYC